MAPELKRTPGGSESENAQAQCPVCLSEEHTETSYFPCGHSVCTSCNATLLQRGFLSCPTCRTPRYGVSQAAVEHANQQRALQNQGQENGGADMAVGMTVSQVRERYRVLFFPDESQGSPFATLGRPRARPGGQNRTGRQEGQGQEVEEAAEVGAEEENGENGVNWENRTPGVRMRLDGPMADLVDGLLNPVNVTEFLARRQRV